MEQCKMMFQNVVQITEQREFITAYDPHDFQDAVMVLFSDVNRFSFPCCDTACLADKQAFVVL